MKQEALYNRTVDILVQAYFNDRLEHGDCTACAVGNLVCANMFKGNWNKWNERYHRVETNWCDVLCTMYGEQFINKNWYINSAKRQIESTGYKIDELAKIEFAFESSRKFFSEEEDMFNGLMAVIDQLDIIHENTDTQTTETTKLKFKKQLA